ncbi:CBS domain-containing protein [Halomonas sp. ZH2S]|uniref:CBS domain-containing protein n=1 Tax=Vreelandella zhuhanensis TaxID=2684210 RepID=A0A7X3GYX6_9GAMM|nr:CBS domain-containing protein [Halomonas zhuhanensis]MWJ27099.1 CBS domain-containing protein [Halomonas zhuhanensis]
MQANDVMTQNVITVEPDTQVREIARLLMENRISAVPVVNAEGKVLGIVSEGDLMRRVENGTDQRKSWWLKSIFTGANDAGSYVKSHGRKASEIMTPKPLTIEESMPLEDVARLLEKHHIKRVPVVRNDKLVGIVSRANLLQGLASTSTQPSEAPADDRAIRDAIMKEIEDNAGVRIGGINVLVENGNVELWGLVDAPEQRTAAEVAAENTNGVKKVENNLGLAPRGVGGY